LRRCAAALSLASTRGGQNHQSAAFAALDRFELELLQIHEDRLISLGEPFR